MDLFHRFSTRRSFRHRAKRTGRNIVDRVNDVIGDINLDKRVNRTVDRVHMPTRGWSVPGWMWIISGIGLGIMVFEFFRPGTLRAIWDSRREAPRALSTVGSSASDTFGNIRHGATEAFSGVRERVAHRGEHRETHETTSGFTRSNDFSGGLGTTSSGFGSNSGRYGSNPGV